MGTLLRLDWKRWLILLLAGFSFVWWAGLSIPVRHAFETLANHPDVQTAFTDADHGRMDALLMLASVAALAPVTSFVAVLVLVFALIVFALLLQPVLGPLRLPAWLSAAVVLGGAAFGAYALRELWLPPAVQLAGLMARAWVVYASTPPPLPH